jgi:CheY-specific phosphatase CheX
MALAGNQSGIAPPNYYGAQAKTAKTIALRRLRASSGSGDYAIHTFTPPTQGKDIMSTQEKPAVYGTEDILMSLCNSVTKVLSVATQTHIHYSGMVQRITKTCLKPDIGCFVLFDGGFSGLVVINFSSQAAMELYQTYMLHMGMPESEFASSHTADEVSNVMGELMNQIVGDFTGKVRRELQTHITQNQPKMLVLNKQLNLSVDANLDRPEARRVTFYTANNNIFYLELAMDHTEFIKLYDFETHDEPDPDALIEEASKNTGKKSKAAPKASANDNDDLLASLGM